MQEHKQYIQVIVQEVDSQLIDKEYVYQLLVDKLEIVNEILQYLQDRKSV